MHASLPTELVMAIAVEAAEHFVVTDRASAVSLALAAHQIYQIVRPVLMRRVYIIDSNCDSISEVITGVGVGALILDLTFIDNWDLEPNVVSCLTNLRCIRGTSEVIDKTISLLPHSARESLRDLHVFYEDVISSMPPQVRRICVYFDELEGKLMDCLMGWLHAAPSITHLGAEFVDRWDIPSEELIQALERVLTAAGPFIQLIAIRVCGDSANGDQWEHLLGALKSWSRNSAMAAIQADRRVALWRDLRSLRSPENEIKATLDDVMAGVNVWSEARALAEW